ncbi:S1C family serine protease [Enterocloster bolteae]|uniref:S1C family serine protease n=1 Tax=Enterocloster bolteae TaxID=208479 RepID=UPI000465D1DF|nr:trypsin-like peptidase domain-containing protein [Enterocloster bolteae]UOX69977.1 trypsin-like peptidase domain-containing protein [Enterocloster bolteae]
MYDNDQNYGWKSYDNQSYDNRQYGGDPYGRRPQPEDMPPKKKKGGILKKAALITAGALLFGTVSGATMVGVNVAASRFMGNSAAASAEAEKKEEISKAQTESQDSSQDNGQGSAQGNGGYQQGQRNNGKAVADVSDIVEQAMPTVVAITSTAVYQSNNYGYGWFFRGGPQTYEVPSSGSGIIVGENDKELLIVTNNHVVEDSTSLKVAFIDSEVVDAAIKGTDAETDLAVIAVPLEQIKDDTKSKIKVARLGNSDELKVGQGVIAIGNALGYGQSVTVGYVSALNREVRVSSTSTRELLQTDAAINPGNSGGALLNMKGEVIGINAAKYSSTEVEGIGYAIPISKAEDIMNQLMNRKTMNPVEEAKRGYLGIQGTSVDEESAAAQSDLREKDIITKVDGQSVRNMTDLQELLACYEMGEQIDLTVQTQKDGEYQERTVTITLKAMPQENTETQAQ